MKNLFNSKKKVMYFSIIGILLLIGVTFAYWALNFTQTNSNLISSACFDITFEDQDNINIAKAYPMLDSEGKTLTPYTFTIKNKCSSYASFQVNLEVLNNSTLNSSFVKAMFNEGTPKLLTSYSAVTKTLNNASSAYKMTQGYLHPNESITYTLRLWIDENVTMEDNISNKTFASKVTVVSTYKNTAPTSQEECEARYGEGASICNIIASADPDNTNCLKLNEDGSIKDPNSTTEEPIICTMEDDYGTSYYLRGNHQDNNVKFAGMCWKLVRVTGTGGLKLIYNGDLDSNGKCTTTSGEHLGFTGQTLSLSGNKVYGTSYSKEGTTYTLSDTSTMNWTNDSASILGKYTCGDTNTTCTTLYVVTGEYSSSDGYVLKLDQSTNYAQIGTTAFNYHNASSNSTESASPALVGYMYNNTYPYKSESLSSNTNNYYYGESFTYNNGSYTLNNTVQFADVSDSTNKTLLNTHHYTCFNATDATCTEMYYLYNLYNISTLYYIKLNGNETGPDALNKMVTNNDINVKNSHIKGVLDWWYEQNIKNTEYESKLEDTIFCNDRTIDNIGGWSETGSLSSGLDFNGGNSKYYLKCPNKRDAFTVSDGNKGNSALTYPVGLLTTAEHSLIGNYTANKTGAYYWASAPNDFIRFNAVERFVFSSGDWYYYRNGYATYGARPAVSLLPGTNFKAGGDGTASNPYEVE